MVVVLADVFPDFSSFRPSQVEAAGPRLRVRAGIVESNFVFQSSGVRTRKAFGQVKTIRVGQSIAAHPEFFVEADSVDDQRIAFPTANGVAVVTGDQILRMFRAVEVDDAV